jgi:protein-S-isoprenylcysteine O-methyltransferase Ste14
MSEVASSVCPQRQTPRWRSAAATLLVLWFAILLYRTNHYYQKFLSEKTQEILLWTALGSSALLIVACPFRKAAGPSHSLTALSALWRWTRECWAWLRSFSTASLRASPCVTNDERISFLFLLLKFFYLPMMLEFLLANWDMLSGRWWSYSGVLSMPRLKLFNEFIFPCLIDVFFISECALYAFGYAFESPRLKNVIKSIEPTMLGWLVALACYPPFNGFVNNYVAWYTSDDPVFVNPTITALAKTAVLLCFAIYVWGAISLGTRCSNLTNRGIVATGAFRFIRHPAYAAKNLAWWICLLPNLSVPAVLSMTFWTFLYFLRAVTEERHLSTDPAYRAYCQKVRWRFIPGVL